MVHSCEATLERSVAGSLDVAVQGLQPGSRSQRRECGLENVLQFGHADKVQALANRSAIACLGEGDRPPAEDERSIADGIDDVEGFSCGVVHGDRFLYVASKQQRPCEVCGPHPGISDVIFVLGAQILPPSQSFAFHNSTGVQR